jgi:hypothetical protein
MLCAVGAKKSSLSDLETGDCHEKNQPIGVSGNFSFTGRKFPGC